MGWRAPWSSLISGNDLIHSNPLGTARFKNFFLQGCTLKASPQNDKYLFLPSLSPLSPTAAETRWGQESRGLRTVPGCGCWNQGPPRRIYSPGNTSTSSAPAPASPPSAPHWGRSGNRDAVAANSPQPFLSRLRARDHPGSPCPADPLRCRHPAARQTGFWPGSLGAREWARASHAGASLMARIPRGEAEHAGTSARATRGSPCAWLRPIYFPLSTF